MGRTRPVHRSHSAVVVTSDRAVPMAEDKEAYAKLSLKKYRPIAARNEDKNVFSGLL